MRRHRPYVTWGLLVATALLAGCADTRPGEATLRPATSASASEVHRQNVAPAPSDITKSRLFSGAIVEILNRFDLGDTRTKVDICGDVSGVLAEVDSSEMQELADAMDNYDYSILMDLVGDCNNMVG